MRRNRNDNAKKERIIMIASSAFVLAALTMTGVYMQSKDRESQNDGYTIDFTALENSADDKSQEIAQNLGDALNPADSISGLEDDLDYPLLEAGSNDIEIPGLTDRDKTKEKDKDGSPDDGKSNDVGKNDDSKNTDTVKGNESSTAKLPEGETSTESSGLTTGGQGTPTETPQRQETVLSEGSPVIQQELHYAESEGLVRPVSGETLIPFSMEKSVYFETLDQYKRNNALIISAKEGTAVTACAEGKVVDIFQNEEIGHAVTMELGDGYRITYGQLRDIQVAMGSYVNAGDIIGSVASPTKYYVREGSNLYLKMTSGDTPIDPEKLF